MMGGLVASVKAAARECAGGFAHGVAFVFGVAVFFRTAFFVKAVVVRAGYGRIKTRIALGDVVAFLFTAADGYGGWFFKPIIIVITLAVFNNKTNAGNGGRRGKKKA